VRFGLYLPTVNDFADPEALIEIARVAERSGWDGVFLWDHVAWATAGGPARILDTWVTLGAIAARTSRIRIGPLVTPAARRRPHKLAREAVTLDRLAAGRLTLGVGLGAPAEMEFAAFGEDGAARSRARRLDEALDLMARLWSGEAVDFEGAYHRASTTGFMPRPVQLPRVPIWVAGSARPRPIERAARWDGMFPMPAEWPRSEYSHADFAAIRERMEALRGDGTGPFDLVHATASGSRPTTAEVDAMGAVGVTWWLTSFFVDDSPGQALAIAAEPPTGH
jgi:alkanesulfonate monooxygenase SsuD/methylene tetrahydromethanopterin reductase-like flavin-dependent oxidoreductase (luciferase family)